MEKGSAFILCQTGFYDNTFIHSHTHTHTHNKVITAHYYGAFYLLFFLPMMQDLSGSMVVSDIQVISDRTVIPHGYCFIPEFMEPSESL